jgi:hypothetical protein
MRRVLLAELEVFHNRPYSPTRRLALGRANLPVEPAPGFGALLLGGIGAVAAESLDDDDHDELRHLAGQLERGLRVVQPRLRHRFQEDHQGLARTVALLIGGGEELEFDFVGHGQPLQMALAAVYAAGRFPLSARPQAMAIIAKGLAWRGSIDKLLIAHLSGGSGGAWSSRNGDPLAWALETLGLPLDGDPGKRDVNRRYRDLLREAHPDHGGIVVDAAERISDLTEARRILLSR